MPSTIQPPYNFNQKARSIAILTRPQIATNNMGIYSTPG